MGAWCERGCSFSVGGMADIEWGNVAEWVAAIGTIAALIFALVVLKGELEARGEAREDRRLRYAGGVTGWLEEKYVYEGDPPRGIRC
jgi:hypothetical protein